MTSSICSSYSDVSFGGEIVSADVAIDQAFKDLQEGVNETHVTMRNMLTSDERGEEYEVLKEQFDGLAANVKEAIVLLKEVTKIAKQIVPPKPKNTPADIAKAEKSIASMTGSLAI